MINAKIYQSIYEELDKYLFADWKKIVIYLEYGKASYSFSFYVQNDKEYIKCFDLPGVSDNELMASFNRIDELVSKERKKEKELWTNMTMIIDSKGNMHSDFDYTDLSKGTYQYKKNWKNKYLK